jgi:hypothetical protein
LARTVADHIRYVHDLVEATLRRFGPAASGLRILDISTTEPVPPPRPGLQSGQHLRVIVGTGPELRGPSVFGAHFSMTVPLAEATLATVEQVQEGVIEMSYSPVPQCPDHQHPLKAVLDDGVLSWVCPVDVTHYSEPILLDQPTGPTDPAE